MNPPRRLGIRQLFALMGVALTDAEFWAMRPRPRKTKLVLGQTRDPHRRRPKLTAARLTAWHRARDQAELEAKQALVHERQLERARRKAA